MQEDDKGTDGPACKGVGNDRRQRSHRARQKDRERITRLMHAFGVSAAQGTYSLSPLSRLKMRFPECWLAVCEDYSPASQHERTLRDPSPRASLRRNNRLHRNRTVAFVERLERSAIASGKMVDPDIWA